MDSLGEYYTTASSNTVVSTFVNTSRVCSGCGAIILQNHTCVTYKLNNTTISNRPYLYFCKNCANHINRGGAIFFRAYTFDRDLRNF